MSKNKVIKLCCGGRGCPTIRLSVEDSNYVYLTDDYGKEIKIKKEEAALIHKALEEL